jgi:hypothetical protein
MPSRHPDEDVFEDYAFERLGESEIAHFEEHLLVCERCQQTLARTDDYIRLMKAATSVFAGGLRETPAIPRTVPIRRDEGLRWNAAAAAILLFTCLTALFSWRNPSGDPKVVELQAYRGESRMQSEAPAGRILDLKIDLKDVGPAGAYRVEVVDATGHRVWFGGTPALVSPGLSPGDYWVRLATDTGEPLREFGLHVE